MKDECPEMRWGPGGKEEKEDWRYFPVCSPFFSVHHWKHSSFHSQKCPRLDDKLYNYPRGVMGHRANIYMACVNPAKNIKVISWKFGHCDSLSLTHSWVKGRNVSIPQFRTSNCYKGYEFKWFLSLKLQKSPVKFPGLSGTDSTHLNYLSSSAKESLTILC